jgi:hypothetical protein
MKVATLMMVLTTRLLTYSVESHNNIIQRIKNMFRWFQSKTKITATAPNVEMGPPAESKANDNQNKYAWDFLLPGFLDVLICASIIVTNRVFGEQIKTTNEAAAKVIDGLETGAILNLIGICYGMLNNQISCRKSIEYYTIGHTSFHKRLIPSDDATLNGVVWGIHGAWSLSAILGFLQGALTVTLNFTRPAMSYTPFAIATASYSVLTLLGAYVFSNSNRRRAYWQSQDLNTFFNQAIPTTLRDGEDVDLRKIPEHKWLDYLSCADRSMVGYYALPIAAVGEMVTYGIMRGLR